MDALLIFTLIWYGVGFITACIETVRVWRNGVDITVWTILSLFLWAAFGFSLLLEYLDLLEVWFGKFIHFVLIKGKRHE